MLNSAVIKRISEVETKKDFDDLIESFKLSSADRELKEEAIRYLKEKYPNFDIVDKLPTKELLEEIKMGEADINDICN